MLNISREYKTMRGVKAEYKELDYVFAHESQVSDRKWLAIIASSYATDPFVSELARRRYRKREHRFKTCRQLFISEATYYKRLRSFLETEKKMPAGGYVCRIVKAEGDYKNYFGEIRRGEFKTPSRLYE